MLKNAVKEPKSNNYVHDLHEDKDIRDGSLPDSTTPNYISFFSFMKVFEKSNSSQAL